MMERVRQIVLGVLLVCLASWCRADIPPEVVARAKQATALVEVKGNDGIAEGSAFCIDGIGMFVTNAHVVEPLVVGGKLTLVLRSGEKDQKIVAAHVIALDKEADLAILQTDTPLKLTPLTLGSSDNLLETMSVVAFGYPFGSELALKEGDYPSISVSTGHITALRKSKGELHSIQLDASLNPGNSGGPVLNEKGEVIGIVQEGIPGSGINDAIPVTSLRALVGHAQILFTPPAIVKEHLLEAQEFRIQLLTQPQGASEVSVELSLSTGAGDHRSFHAVSKDGRTFTVQAPLVPAHVGPTLLQLTIRSRNNEIVGTVPDQTFRVGDTIVPLSRVSSIENSPSSQIILSDERILRGAITGLSSVNVDLDGVQTNLNLGRFDTIVVSPPVLPASVEYHILAKQDGKVLGDLTGKIALQTGRVSAAEGTNGARGSVADRGAHKGVLIVAADEVATNDSNFDQVPGDSVVHFIRNLAYYFVGGRKGKFLIYSTNKCFGNRFQQTLQEAGHTVTQTMSPESLSRYDAVFVCGNGEVSVKDLAAYIQGGGCVYLAGGTGGNEPGIFNDFLKPFGIEYQPFPNDYSTVQATAFGRSPLFNGVDALVIHGINPIKLLPGDWPHRSVACSQDGHIYWVVNTADVVVTDGTNKGPQLTPDQGAYTLNSANGHWYGAVFLDYSVSWKEAKAAAEAMVYKGKHGHLVTITSASENDFVLRTFAKALDRNPWIGAYKDTQAPDYRNPSSGWHWVTGELWQYTNWLDGEPNGANGGPHSDFLQFWNHGHWNDQGNTPPNAIDAVKALLVEFD
ncbi:MAG: mucD 8 [Chthonomonadales bacterium]|nr:mucD 8 [Chthonomonadales bacterium]